MIEIEYELNFLSALRQNPPIRTEVQGKGILDVYFSFIDVQVEEQVFC